MPALSAFAWLPWLIAAELTGPSAAAASSEGVSGRLDASLIHTGIGPWGGVARAEAGAESANAWSLGFEYSALAYMNMGRLTARYRHLYRIGGGQAGVDGGVDVDVQIGRLWSLAPYQSLVARVGARGYIYGNNRLSASLLELPAAEAGYQLLSESWHVELLGHGGPVLLGAHRTLDTPAQKLGGTVMYGARGALGWRALNAEVGWFAIGAEGYRLEVSGCAIAGKLGLCAELARLSTDDGSGSAPGQMPGGGVGERTSQSILLWLSVGASERK